MHKNLSSVVLGSLIFTLTACGGGGGGSGSDNRATTLTPGS